MSRKFSLRCGEGSTSHQSSSLPLEQAIFDRAVRSKSKPQFIAQLPNRTRKS